VRPFSPLFVARHPHSARPESNRHKWPSSTSSATPDPRLNKVARPVDVVDAAIRQLVDDMLETMYEA